MVIIEGNPGQDATYWRSTAFADELQRIAPGIRIVGRQTARWDRARAIGVAENFLTTYPDLSGIMAQNDDMAIGAVQAVQAAGKTQQVKVVSINASREGLDAVRGRDLRNLHAIAHLRRHLHRARSPRRGQRLAPPPRWIRNSVIRVDKSNAGKVFGDW